MAEQSIAERLRALSEDDFYSTPWTTKCTLDEAADLIDRLTKERDEARKMLTSALQWFEDNRVALQKVGPGTLPTWVRDGWGALASGDTANG